MHNAKKENLISEIFGRVTCTHRESASQLDDTLTDAKYALFMQELGFETGDLPASESKAYIEFVAEGCIEDAVRSVINAAPSFTDRFSDLIWLYDMTNEAGMSMSKAAAWLNSSQEAMLEAISSNKQFKAARDELIAEFNRRSEHLGIVIDVNNLKAGSIA